MQFTMQLTVSEADVIEAVVVALNRQIADGDLPLKDVSIRAEHVKIKITQHHDDDPVFEGMTIDLAKAIEDKKK
jgi:hypothetical protein